MRLCVVGLALLHAFYVVEGSKHPSTILAGPTNHVHQQQLKSKNVIHSSSPFGVHVPVVHSPHKFLHTKPNPQLAQPKPKAAHVQPKHADLKSPAKPSLLKSRVLDNEISKEPTQKEIDAKNRAKWAAFNPRHAADVLEKYLEKHPAVASEALSWVIVGAVFLLVATSLLLFSEIRAVLVIREQDFREHMVASNYMQPKDTIKEVQVSEEKVMSERPYLTLFSMIMLFVSMVCLLKPFCNVLDIIGLPSSSCFLTVGFSAFVASVTSTCLLMGLCWSCTRGIAACVLVSIGLSGDLLCPTGSPVLVVSWLLVAGAVYFLYFIFLPEQEKVPAWCQSIGPMRPSMDPLHWKHALAGPNPDAPPPPVYSSLAVPSYGAVPVTVAATPASRTRCTV